MEGGKLQSRDPPTPSSKERGQRLMMLSSLFPVLPSSRSTIFVRLHTNGHPELQYQPGDHLGVFPGNREDLVNALMERLEDAPPINQLVKVELLEERSTALGKDGPADTPPAHSQALPFSGGPRGSGDPFLVPVTNPGRRVGLSPPAYETEHTPHFSWRNSLGPWLLCCL